MLSLYPHPDNFQMLFHIAITLSQLGEGETALAVTLLVVRPVPMFLIGSEGQMKLDLHIVHS